MEEFEVDFEEDFEEEEGVELLEVDMQGVGKALEMESEPENEKEVREKEGVPLREEKQGTQGILGKLTYSFDELVKQNEIITQQNEDMKRDIRALKKQLAAIQGGDVEESISPEESIWSLWSKRRKAGKQRQALVGILQNTDFNAEQIREICAGVDEGLTLKEIQGYAKKELSAKSMETIRTIYRKMMEVK